MQAVTVFRLDGVLLVIEHGAQAFVKVRDVIAAVEIIVDEYFPVAMNVVGAAIEVTELTYAKRRNASREAADKFGERWRAVIEIDEDETFPGFHANGDKAVLRAIKIFDAFELGHAFERSVQPVVPAMIGTV